MATRFPTMTPSSRSITMGDLPIKVYRAMSGATVRRAFGNQKTQYVLKLKFNNIGDDSELRAGAGTVLDILKHYESTNGTLENFVPGPGLFQGMGAASKGYIKDVVKWRYAKPPEIQSVKEGVSNVSVELIAELNA